MSNILRTVRTAAARLALPLLLAACAGASGDAPAPGNDSGEAAVSIEPRSGPVGTGVQVEASGFPPGTEVEIGFGPPRSEYTVLTRASTTDEGRVSTVVSVPGWAEAGRDYVFVVAGPANRPKAVSGAFRVSG